MAGHSKWAKVKRIKAVKDPPPEQALQPPFPRDHGRGAHRGRRPGDESPAAHDPHEGAIEANTCWPRISRPGDQEGHGRTARGRLRGNHLRGLRPGRGGRDHQGDHRQQEPGRLRPARRVHQVRGQPGRGGRRGVPVPARRAVPHRPGPDRGGRAPGARAGRGGRRRPRHRGGLRGPLQCPRLRQGGACPRGEGPQAGKRRDRLHSPEHGPGRRPAGRPGPGQAARWPGRAG